MKPVVKKVLLGLAGLVGLVAVGGGGFVWAQTSGYASSMEKVYDIPVPDVTASTEPAVLARGKHLSESFGACATSDCHGSDLSGGKVMEMGPLGTLTGPNISSAGMGAAYSDGELFRLLRHGIKKGGTSVTFMPVHEFNWLPDDDLKAIISYIRTMPAVEEPNGPISVGLLGKILDQKDAIVLDVARRIDHQNVELAPEPSPTAAYGKYIARMCTGCHGEKLSGGRIPGTPDSIPVPTNITPHETGLKDWTFEDFNRLLDEGVKKNGEKLDPFMPIEAFGKADEIERKAIWEYLQTVTPTPFGER